MRPAWFPARGLQEMWPWPLRAGEGAAQPQSQDTGLGEGFLSKGCREAVTPSPRALASSWRRPPGPGPPRTNKALAAKPLRRPALTGRLFQVGKRRPARGNRGGPTPRARLHVCACVAASFAVTTTNEGGGRPAHASSRPDPSPSRGGRRRQRQPGAAPGREPAAPAAPSIVSACRGRPRACLDQLVPAPRTRARCLTRHPPRPPFVAAGVRARAC